MDMKRMLFILLTVILTINAFSEKLYPDFPSNSFAGNHYHWPTQKLGGGERLLYNEKTFIEIRTRIDSFQWADRLYRKLMKRVALGYKDIPIDSKNPYNAAYWTKEAAMYYRISGDEKYITEIVENIKDFYKLEKPQEPLFPIASNRSNGNFWQRIAEKDCRFLLAYDLTKNHKLLLPFKTVMEKRMDEIIAEAKRYESQIKRLGNTQFWGVTGLGLYGFMRNDKEALEIAINGKHGFKGLLSEFRDNGRFWPEPAHYVYGFGDCCLLLLAEAAKLNGWPENLYTYEHPKNGASMKKMIMSLLSVCTQDGYLIANGEYSEYSEFLFGNFSIERTPFWNKSTRDNSRLPIYYKAYKLPQLAWAMKQRPDYDFYCMQIFGNPALVYGADIDKVMEPNAESVVYQEMGDALIRSDETQKHWYGKGLSVYLRNGASQQYHSNDDHCSININVFGKNLYNHWFLYWDYLCPRKGRANNTPLSFTIFNQNTVAVDCKGPERSNIHLSQNKEEREGLQFSEIERLNNMKRISVSGEVYEGVHQTRTICTTDEYVLDLFTLKSSEEHTYDYILHSWGDVKIAGVSKVAENFDLNKEYGFGPIDGNAKKRKDNVWFLSGSKGVIDTDVAVMDFYDPMDSLGVRAFVFSDPTTTSEVMSAYTPYYVDANTGWDGGPYQGQPERKPMGVIRRKCKATTFVVVHQPYSVASQKTEVMMQDGRVIIKSAQFTDVYNIEEGTYKRILFAYKYDS